MELFPTQYSTLSAAALKHSIAQSYGLPVTSCKYLLRGVSDTYVLDGEQEKYILKIYRTAHRSLEELLGEIELLNILKENGCKISYPLHNLAGAQVQPFHAAEGTRYGVVFSFAKGKSSNTISDEQLAIVGHEMAYNHNAAANITLNHSRKEYTTAYTVTDPINILAPIFTEYGLDEEYQWLKSTAVNVLDRLDAIDTASFSYGYCHYDYFPTNFFFDADNNFTLFDFDFAGKGFLMYDLSSIFVHFFFDIMYAGVPKEKSMQSFDAVIASYKKVRSISNDELRAIPLLGFNLLTFYLGFQYENFDDWSNNFFNPRYLKGRVGAMKKYYELLCG